MKLIKPRYDLLLYIFIPFSLISTFIFLWFPEQVANLGFVNGLLLITLVILFFTPLFSKKFGDKKPMPFLKWFMGLLVGQVILNLLFWSFLRILQLDLDTFTYQKDLNYFYHTIDLGLFPWAFTLFCALILGYATYSKKKLGLLSSTFEPLFKNNHLDNIGIAVDSYMRSITITAVIFLVAMSILCGILLLHIFVGLPLLHGLKFSVVLVGTVLFLVTSHKIWYQLLNRLTHSTLPTSILIIGFIIVATVVYSFLQMLVQKLVSINPLFDITISSFNPRDPVSFKIVLDLWWLAFSIIAGAFIAFISQGRTFREIIFYSFISFLIVWAGIVKLDNLFINEILPSSLLLVIFLLISLVILFITTQKKYISFYLRGTLPSDQPFKTRSTYLFLKTVPLVSIALLSLYLAWGTKVWGYVSTLALLPPLVLTMIGFLGLFKKD